LFITLSLFTVGFVSGCHGVLAMLMRFCAVFLRAPGVIFGILVIARGAAFGGLAVFFGRFIAALGGARMVFDVCFGVRHGLRHGHGVFPVFEFDDPARGEALRLSQMLET
jgi:hypothetical protein